MSPPPDPKVHDNLIRLGRKSSSDLRSESEDIRLERIDNLVGLSREHAAMIPVIHDNAKKALSEASRACTIATRVETIAEGTHEAVVGLQSSNREMADAVGAMQAAIVNQQVDAANKVKNVAASAANRTVATGGGVAAVIYVALEVARLFMGG
jgi:hypothetical protein